MTNREQSLLTQKNNKANTAFLILGIIFIAFNLRPSITSVGPLVDTIRANLHISNGTAGLLTTLPLIGFALLSILSPKMAKRIGNEWALFVGLLLILIGIAVRSSGWISPLFMGTILLGAGIAIGNVLLPSVVKERFPKNPGMMTSLYTTSMGLMASLASGLSFPLSHGFNLGWQMALSVWGILTVVAICIWLPQLRGAKHKGAGNTPKKPGNTLWRSPLAWQVTLFLGLQSFLFYCLIAWLPEILNAGGMGHSLAGWMVSFVQLIGLPATFLAPVLADRMTNQKLIVLGIGILYILGMCALLFENTTAVAVVSVVLIGLAQGASISTALTFISLRSNTAQQAAALSGMAQSFGYLLAAIGPFLAGLLFDFLHSWTVPLIIMIIVGFLMTAVGLFAGRDTKVG